MNSLPETLGAFDFVWASMRALQQECPQAYTLMCQQISGYKVLLEIDGEPVGLRFTKDQVLPLAVDALEPARIHLQISWQTILDLVDARLTLIEAAQQGRMALFGVAGELANLYEAILTYLRGAVRCPTFPLLLEQVRLQQLDRRREPAS